MAFSIVAPTTLDLNDLRWLAVLKLHREAHVDPARAHAAVADADRRWLLSFLCGGGARIENRPIDAALLAAARRLARLAPRDRAGCQSPGTRRIRAPRATSRSSMRS